MHHLSNDLKFSMRKRIIDLLKDKAVIIKTNYTIEEKTPKDKSFSLDELQAAVDGYIDVYPQRVITNTFMFIDEDAKEKNKIKNVLVDDLFGVEVLGDVIIAPYKLLHT